MPVPTVIDLNNATPTAPSGFQNSQWQADTNNPRNVSTNVPNTGGVNAQTTSYTAVAADCGKIISFNSVSAVTLTLPAAIPFGQWEIDAENVGTGTLTVNRNGLTIDGAAANFTLTTNQGTVIKTNGSNYFTQRGISGFPNPMTAEGDTIVGGASGAPNRLAVGADGKVLTANSTATDGVDWEAPIALTTTGSGAATLSPGNPYTLNIPTPGGGGGAMVQISRQVLGSPAASVTFSGISATFNHLMLMVTTRSSATTGGAQADSLTVTINSDNTAGHYNIAFNLFGTTSASGSIASSNFFNIPNANAAANYPATTRIWIPDYANTAFFKTLLVENNYPGNSTSAAAVTGEQLRITWSATPAAIGSIVLGCGLGNFVAGSIFTLYGLT